MRGYCMSKMTMEVENKLGKDRREWRVACGCYNREGEGEYVIDGERTSKSSLVTFSL